MPLSSHRRGAPGRGAMFGACGALRGETLRRQALGCAREGPCARGCGCCVRARGGRGGAWSIPAPRRGRPLLRNLPPSRSGQRPRAGGVPARLLRAWAPAGRAPLGRLPAQGGNAPRPADPSTRAGAAHLAPSGLRVAGGVGAGRLGAAGLRSLLVVAGAPRLLHQGGLAFSGSSLIAPYFFPFPLPPAPGAKFTASAMRWVWLPRRF